jgi:hypothetical protein
MGDMERLDHERPKVELLAGLEVHEGCPVQQPVLLEFAAHHAHRERRAVDRREAEVGQQVRNGPDMVFVAVGQQDALDLVLLVVQIGDIGQYQIDPEHIGFGEHHAAVEQQDLLAALEHPHVAPNLAGTTERDHAQSVLCHTVVVKSDAGQNDVRPVLRSFLCRAAAAPGPARPPDSTNVCSISRAATLRLPL